MTLIPRNEAKKLLSGMSDNLFRVTRHLRFALPQNQWNEKDIDDAYEAATEAIDKLHKLVERRR